MTVNVACPAAIIRLSAVCLRVCSVTSPVVMPARSTARRKTCAVPLTVNGCRVRTFLKTHGCTLGCAVSTASIAGLIRDTPHPAALRLQQRHVAVLALLPAKGQGQPVIALLLGEFVE